MKLRGLILAVIFFAISSTACLAEQMTVENRLGGLLKEGYDARDIQVKLESVPAHLKQDAKVRSVSIYTMPDIGGKGLAFVEFEGEDRKARSSYVPFRVYEKKKLFYAKRALQRGSFVSTDDVASKEAYVSDSELLYPKDVQELNSKVLKRDVAPGTVLTTVMLDSPQVVRRGEMVTIVAENRQLLVKAKGKAEEPGRVGDKIRVKNLSSEREIVGKVAGDGTVIVEF